VNMVLATDMTKHFTDISKIKSGIQESCKETIERERESESFQYNSLTLFTLIGLDFEIEGKDKKLFLGSILHSSDESNPIRLWKICFQWTTKVMAEFWAQGDQENC